MSIVNTGNGVHMQINATVPNTAIAAVLLAVLLVWFAALIYVSGRCFENGLYVRSYLVALPAFAILGFGVGATNTHQLVSALLYVAIMVATLTVGFGFPIGVYLAVANLKEPIRTSWRRRHPYRVHRHRATAHA